MEKKNRVNYETPIAEAIEIVIEQAVLNGSGSGSTNDYEYGGDLSN